MVAVPPATPYTEPEVGLTVAIPVALLLQVPLPVALLNTDEAETQAEAVPVIEAGVDGTVLIVTGVVL